MNIIIGNGLIGRNLSYKLRDTVLLTRKEIDLSKDGWELPKCKTAYICAGVTSTKECEEHPEETRRVNVENTIKLADKLGCHVVFLSSERVFDGSKPFRKVTDEVCPVTEYGRQKAEVEKVLLGMGACVIRFSKVIGWGVPLFEGWIDALKKGHIIYPYSNMSMSPLPVSFAVDFIERVGKFKGLYQVSALEDISYDRIAYHIANYMGVPLDLVSPYDAKIGHVNSTLDDNGISKQVGLNIPDSWDTIYKWCKNVFLGRTR